MSQTIAPAWAIRQANSQKRLPTGQFLLLGLSILTSGKENVCGLIDISCKLAERPGASLHPQLPPAPYLLRGCLASGSTDLNLVWSQASQAANGIMLTAGPRSVAGQIGDLWKVKNFMLPTIFCSKAILEIKAQMGMQSRENLSQA
jgi:hypothetical protein